MKNHKNCNTHDHQKWNRRSFLQTLGLAGVGSVALANTNVDVFENNALTQALANNENDRILVLVRLFGGNDGLNTIVPLNQYDLYANYRPTLKRDPSDLWNLSDDYAMPNLMNTLTPNWNEGAMKIVHSVGYENQSQSHFKGSDIWGAASSDTAVDTGWMGRYFKNKYADYVENQPDFPVALQIGTSNNNTFHGDDVAAYSFAIQNMSKLASIINSGELYDTTDLPDCTYGDKVSFVRALTNSTNTYASVIHEAYSNSTDYTDGVGYDTENSLGTYLNVIARLIKGGIGTKVFMLTMGGYDTHSNQAGNHDALLTSLSQSIRHFHDDLKAAGYGDNVLSMVFSEFGRRVADNGSGTDHGVAGPIMFFGDALNGSGFVGEFGSIEEDQLYRGRDLQWKTDFKQVYASVLKDWMCVDNSVVDEVIIGQNFDSLDLGFQCDSKTLSNPKLRPTIASFRSNVFYENGITYINISNQQAQHIVISLYDLNGQFLGEVINDILSIGNYKLDIKQKLQKDITRGYYIYRVSCNSRNESRKVLVL